MNGSNGWPPLGMLWSDAIGWYYPVCVPRLISDRNATSGVKFVMVPVPPSRLAEDMENE